MITENQMKPLRPLKGRVYLRKTVSFLPHSSPPNRRGILRREIREKLREVIDPELGISIIDLGLVYKIKVGEGDVSILMTLTTPGCPMAEVFNQEVAKKIKEIKGVKKVHLELTFDPPWTPEKMSKEAKKRLGWPDSGNQ